MLKLYCVERQHGGVHVLAGWVGPGKEWDAFDIAWKSILETLAMPDGSPCRVLSPSRLADRDSEESRAGRGWSRAEARLAYSRATDVLVDPGRCPSLEPLGCAVEVPDSIGWVHRDGARLFLFFKVYDLLAKRFPGSEVLVTMNEAAVRDNAARLHALATTDRRTQPAIRLAFGRDEDNVPLQAAALLASGWLGRIIEASGRPVDPVHVSYERVRASRRSGVFWRYGADAVAKAQRSPDQAAAAQRWVEVLREETPTFDD
jgi:hypothetical protein